MRKTGESRAPVRNLAKRFLRDYVDRHSLSAGDRLPPVRQLAAMAEVSFVTMIKALREWRTEGLVCLPSDRAYRLGSLPLPPQKDRPPLSAPHPIETRQRPQRVIGRMIEDIRTGHYRHGSSLPSLIELQGRYRAGYRTVRKALSHLLAQGVLEEIPGGGVAVPALRGGGPTARIVSFVESPDAHTFTFGQNGTEVFRNFEALCSQARIAIDHHLLFLDEQGRTRFRHLKSGRIYDRDEIDWVHDESVLGYAYILHMAEETRDADLAGLRWCLRSRRPVCVLDESGGLRLPEAMAASRHLRMLTASSADPGVAVGRELLSWGHRRIAFISTYPRHPWSIQRLDGLTSAFGAAGYAGSVVPFVANDRPWQETGALHSRLSSLERAYARWRMRAPAQCRPIYDQAFENLRFESAIDAAMLVALAPLMEKALRDPGITAWAMANDALASMAIPVLKKKGIGIPADLSIVSFDDSVRALKLHFSSYNFNHQAFAASMLGFILKRKPHLDAKATIPGFIVDRGTVGPAAGRTER